MTSQLTGGTGPRKSLGSMPHKDTAARDRGSGDLPPFTTEELLMLDFATRWAPFGGAESGDVLIEFGISRSQFYARVDRLQARAAGRAEPTTVRSAPNRGTLQLPHGHR